MRTSLDELAKRVDVLEKEVAQIKQGVNGAFPSPFSESREPELLRLARLNQPAISAAVDKAFKEMGIVGEPIGAENVQKLIADELRKKGITPEDNYFSRAIIAAREE